MHVNRRKYAKKRNKLVARNITLSTSSRRVAFVSRSFFIPSMSPARTAVNQA